LADVVVAGAEVFADEPADDERELDEDDALDDEEDEVEEEVSETEAKDSETDGVARLQNCCASDSAVPRLAGQFAAMQLLRPFAKIVVFVQKHWTSTTLSQLVSATASSRHVSTQVE